MSSRGLAPLVEWRGAIAASDLPATAKLVAWGLGNYMNARGGSAFPALRTLAADCSCAKSTVVDALKLLEERRFLARTVGGGRGRRTIYEALIPQETVVQADPLQAESEPVGRPVTATSGRLTGPPQAGDLHPHVSEETVGAADRIGDSETVGVANETVQLTSEKGRPGRPEVDQDIDHEAAAARLQALEGNAAAAFLRGELEQLRLGAKLLELAWSDPQRAIAWVQLAKAEAQRNRAGFVAAGLRSGVWPSPRGGAVSSAARRRSWAQRTAPRLGEEVARLVLEEWARDGVVDQAEHDELLELALAAIAGEGDSRPGRSEAAA